MGKYRSLGNLFDRIFRNDLNANFNDIDSDIKVQKARVDNLITGNPQPEEVMDLRTDTDGVIHGTAWDRFASDESKKDTKFQEIDAQLADIVNISVKKLGAKGDGITDDTQAFIDAINLANTQSGKTVITIEKGNFKIPNGDLLPTITAHDVYIKGMGIGVTTLSFTDGTYFKIGGDSGLLERGGISNLTISYVYGHTASASLVVLAKNCSGQKYENLRLLNTPTFLQAGTTQYKAYSQRLEKISLAHGNLGVPAIKLVNGAGFYWEDGTGGFVSGVNPPVGESDMTTVEGTNFLDIVGNWDTVRLANFLERWYKNINIQAPAGTTILNITIRNSFYDYTRYRCVDVNSSGGTIGTFTMQDCVMNSWEDDGMNFFSTGFLRAVYLKNCTVQFTGRYGIIFGGNMRYFNVVGGTIGKIGRKTPATGIQVGSGLKGFELMDIRLGGLNSDDTENKTSLQIIGDNTDEYIVTRCKAFRFEINVPTQTSANASKKRLVTDNIWIGNEAGYSYDGYRSTGRYVLPASGTTWYNTSPYKVEVHIYGGAVSSLTKDGVSLNPSGASFELLPGQNFALTYTTAPTIRYYVKP